MNCADFVFGRKLQHEIDDKLVMKVVLKKSLLFLGGSCERKSPEQFEVEVEILRRNTKNKHDNALGETSRSSIRKSESLREECSLISVGNTAYWRRQLLWGFL